MEIQVFFNNDRNHKSAKKRHGKLPCHAHQAIEDMGGRGKCPRYI